MQALHFFGLFTMHRACLLPACLPVCLVMQGRLAAEADAHTRNVEDLQRFLQQVCSQAGAARERCRP